MKFWKFEIKRVDNTKWDYIIPLGFVLLTFFYFTYYRWNCFDCSLNNRLIGFESFKQIIYTLPIAFSSFFLVTFLLGRIHRIIVIPILPMVITVLFTEWFRDFHLFHPVNNLWGFFGIYGGLQFLIGNLFLISRFGFYGSNSISVKRMSLGVGFLGMSTYASTGALGCKVLFMGPFCPTYIARYDFFTKIFHYKHYVEYSNDFFIYPSGFFTWFIIFFFIGLAFEKYNQRKRKN